MKHPSFDAEKLNFLKRTCLLYALDCQFERLETNVEWVDQLSLFNAQNLLVYIRVKGHALLLATDEDVVFTHTHTRKHNRCALPL